MGCLISDIKDILEANKLLAEYLELRERIKTAYVIVQGLTYLGYVHS